MNKLVQNCTNRNIPEPMQREIRRRCGFGCVICGLPLYEYEHMLGWANVKRHVASEITLLCNFHHRERSGGLLPIENVMAADKAPFNLKSGVTKPYNFHFSGTEASVEIGSNTFIINTQIKNKTSQFIPLMIDCYSLIEFRFEDGQMLLNLIIFDEFNIPILQIKDNILMYSAYLWDIEFVAKKITIRTKSRVILIEIEFCPPDKIKILRGKMLCNGVEVAINKNDVSINKNLIIQGNTVRCSPVGILIGLNAINSPGTISYPYVSRYIR